MAQQQISKDVRDCIDTCMECHSICTETAYYCLTQGGQHADAKHVRLLLDCAEICQTSADYMLRSSDLHGKTCGLCAEVCKRCAESCEKIGQNDELMKKCAEICRRCAESCKKMSSLVTA